MNIKRERIKYKTDFFIRGIMVILSMIIISQIAYSRSSFGGRIDLGEGTREIIDQIISFFTPVFEVVLGDYSSSEFFFTKVMFLVLLTIIIYSILDRLPLFEGYRNVSFVISLVVSTISVRFIAENELINMILMPYGTIGIVITTLLPIGIFTYGIHNLGLPGVGRKIAWIFFGIVFLTLWIYRAPEIGEIGNRIYFWSAIAIGMLVLFDNSIHAYFRGLSIKEFEKKANDSRIANLQTELARLMNTPSASLSPEQKRTIERIKRELRRLGARYEG